MSNNVGSKVSFFLVGLGIGSLIGILFAPKSGEETRDYLSSKADEGRDYARKLEEAGVGVWHVDMNDQLHGFLTWGKLVRAADAALEMAAASLRYAFATAG